jgi:NAD(P)-dependent dehydrogenase (short-subunit alcohol dehydrogenase family)
MFAACQAANDDQIAKLFERVRQEHGRLDVLVNNAIAIPDEMTKLRRRSRRPSLGEARNLARLSAR